MSGGDETRDQVGDDPVERLCEEFELEWKAGRGRPVEHFLLALGLDRSSAPPGLVPELDKLESWYRDRRPAASVAERFAPGTVLAGRYRVEVVLGEGGMGVVYRAFDQTLGKPVALKFLPARMAADPGRRDQFLMEVRSAQEVSHDCVARVHDLGQHGGQPFLSMEYIDGGDLADLLARGGRLTDEAAGKYARQLCRGLAAIHRRGIVHRDLKPQNVMIDGRGQLRITDFGLAGEVGTFTGAAVWAGTPLYQSPEQLAGTGVSTNSDVYSLGLVLYEMFTGRRAYQAATAADLLRLQQADPPVPPSAHVAGLPAGVNDVILKCLDPKPGRRPPRATHVLHQLLRAGGTPTTEDIAEAEREEAGGTEGFSPRTGTVLFALAAVGVLLVAGLNDHTALFRRAIADRDPRELSGKARDVLVDLGFDPAVARDSAHGLATDEYLLAQRRTTPGERLRPDQLRSGGAAVMYFWYRQSPDVLAQRLSPNDTSGWSMPGRVLPNEPPLRDPGMVCVFLDPDGRLLEFHAVPPPEPPDAAAREPDAAAVLRAVGLKDVSLRETTESRRVPPVFADRRLAWEGHGPRSTGAPVRVEAAFYRGRPVYIHVGLDGHPDRLLPGFMPDNGKEKLQEVKNTLLGLAALPVGVWFAWRNWRLRRSNPRGAAILAGGFVGLGMIGWLLAAHHAAWPRDRLAVFKDELSMFTGMFGRVVFDGLLLWLAYLALEPWVRRTSPDRVTSWNRLLQGRWADPLVGRDVLAGVAAAVGFVVVLQVCRALPGWAGYTPDVRLVWDAAFTEGGGSLVLTVQIAVMVAVRGFFLFFLVLLLCRERWWLAGGLTVVVWGALYQHGGTYAPVSCLVGLAYALVSILVLLRAGLLGFVAFNLVEEVLVYMPLTTDRTAWYAGVSTTSLLFVAALATYGYWAACRHRLLGLRAGPV
jgi:serine/threonine-protein kinase